MMISTRGRYALRVLTDMAENSGDGYIPLKQIAARQDISLKYLESIMSLLAKAGMVDSVQGKGGGYRLNRPLSEYRVGEVLRLTEGTLAPVACLEENGELCRRADTCRTLPLWDKLNFLVNDYLDSVSLMDLMEK